ncbi:unnamed protein product [Gongylonema pulchrum]|uniref:Uncharacterized protein n=1 Tax=Gongylonema pulchrum TaxID=637853 RepID=A0A3P6QA52_9BILA|nr:unnamed protein product [Gongylonema pulchrum]
MWPDRDFFPAVAEENAEEEDDIGYNSVATESELRQSEDNVNAVPEQSSTAANVAF